MNEITVIHPLVAQRLTKCGYTYQHEYEMPDYGRVDFYAHKEGEKSILIEAKIRDTAKVIIQLAAYGLQIPDARLIIALPRKNISPKMRGLATKYNMEIMELFTTHYTSALDGLKADFLDGVQRAIKHYGSDFMEYFGEARTPEFYQERFTSELLRLCNQYRKWLSMLEMEEDSINLIIARHLSEIEVEGGYISKNHARRWLEDNLSGNPRSFFTPRKIVKAWVRK